MCRDNLSGLKLVELGAGLTVNDISILAWTPIFTNRTATLTHKIDVPDGHRSFIRLRATNHGQFSMIRLIEHLVGKDWIIMLIQINIWS